MSKNFETLKDALMRSHILVYPDPNKPYTLFTDASKYSWSSVLTPECANIIDDKT